MNKFIFTFILIILIVNAYTSTDSPCTTKRVSSRRNLASLLTEEDCINLETSETTKKCVLNDDEQSCREVEKSQCELKTISNNSGRRLSSLLTEDDCKDLATSENTKKCVLSGDEKSCREVNKSQCELKKISNNSGRRLSSLLTEGDCKDLKTSDDNKFKCILGEDETYCMETTKNPSSSTVNQCTTKYSSRRLSSDLTEEDCSILSTSNNYLYKCVLNSNKNNCKEALRSECEKTYYFYRRLESEELTNEVCEDLETSDDSKYICVVNEDGTGCKEMENSNYLKYTTTLILCLLLFV